MADNGERQTTSSSNVRRLRSSSFLLSPSRPFEASLPSKFVQNVAVSSEYEQEQDLLSDAEEPSV
ncbi:unnamed protein product [Camellia sinensis]